MMNLFLMDCDDLRGMKARFDTDKENQGEDVCEDSAVNDEVGSRVMFSSFT